MYFVDSYPEPLIGSLFFTSIMFMFFWMRMWWLDIDNRKKTERKGFYWISLSHIRPHYLHKAWVVISISLLLVHIAYIPAIMLSSKTLIIARIIAVLKAVINFGIFVTLLFYNKEVYGTYANWLDMHSEEIHIGKLKMYVRWSDSTVMDAVMNILLPIFFVSFLV